MAFSYVDYVSDGQQTAYSFRFVGDGYGYFRESDIHVIVDGEEVNYWSLTAPNQLSFRYAPPKGARILIRRIMPKDLPYSIWKRGNDFSPLTTNNNLLQQLYAMQEIYDGFVSDGFRYNQDLSMGGYRITDLADGVAPNDAVNLKQLMDAETGAGGSAEEAAASAAAARLSEQHARQSELNSQQFRDEARQYSEDSRAAEVASRASAGVSVIAAEDAEGSKTAAHTSSTEAASAAAKAKLSEAAAAEAAIRAEHWASRIDVNELNARIDAQDGEIVKANANASNAVQEAWKATETADGVDGKATDALTKATEALEKATEAYNRPSGSLFEVQWWGGLRAGIPAGWVPADGQIIPYGLYSDVDAVIKAGSVPSAPIPITNRDGWISSASNRGFYAQWDADNFRIPDYNGKQPDSLGAIYVRGDGKNAHSGGSGYMQGDAIRNITGQATNFLTPDRNGLYPSTSSGVLKSRFSIGTVFRSGTSSIIDGFTIEFDASQVVPTANENRPVSATGCWIIRVFGAVTNAGSADAAALATAYANLATEITLIKERAGDSGNFTFKNKIINGNFSVKNRPIDAPGSADFFIADRFMGWNAGDRPSEPRIFDPTIPGISPTAYGINGSPGNTGVTIEHRMESATLGDVRGKRYTFSAWVYSEVERLITLRVYAFPAKDTGTGNKDEITFKDYTIPAARWTKVHVTTPAPTEKLLNGGCVLINFGHQDFGTIYTTDWQFEEGTVVTPFEIRPPTIELQLCQRYFQYSNVGYSGAWVAGALTWNTQGVPFPVRMRVTPSTRQPTSYTIQGVTSNATEFVSSATDSHHTVSCSNSYGQGDGACRLISPNTHVHFDAEL